LIEIEERQPFALWQCDGKVLIVAAEGVPVAAMRDQRFIHLPLVVGAGANEKLSQYMALLDTAGDLRERIVAGVLVAKRRWTLKTANGIEILLPEREPRRRSHGSSNFNRRRIFSTRTLFRSISASQAPCRALDRRSCGRTRRDASPEEQGERRPSMNSRVLPPRCHLCRPEKARSFPCSILERRKLSASSRGSIERSFRHAARTYPSLPRPRIGHQRSRGIKGGAVVDMDAAEAAIRFAVDAAERMAGCRSKA